MTEAPPRTSRRAALRYLADRVLEAPDLPALTRLLTSDLPGALGAASATLLLWDRKLESFDGVALSEGGRLRIFRPETSGPEGPPARWLVSDGQLLETAGRAGEGTLVPFSPEAVSPACSCSGRRLAAPAQWLLLRRRSSRSSPPGPRSPSRTRRTRRSCIASERLAALGTMAGMLAHDFRGPMTVIRGYAETLLADGLSPAEVEGRARLIIEAVDRLERMATETLDFVRGAERLVRRPVPVSLLLLDLAAEIEAELPGIAVVREIQVPPSLRAGLDVDKLRRAVSNMAANARDAMAGRGRLHLRARVERREGPEGSVEALVIVLADEGPGVPAEIRDRVFQPFVTWGKKRGTGLGLAVARRFVEDHGGTLELLDDGEPGARFQIVLPIGSPGAGEGPR